MLDIEVAGAVAPNARFAVYFAPNEGNKGFIDAISAAVHDKQRNPAVISISWGSPESSNEAQAIQAFHELFVAAASLGVTVCVATGDHGVADLDGQSWDGKIHVDHPAVDDMVLACGGTQIDNDVDVVWNDETPFSRRQRATAAAGRAAAASARSSPSPNYQAKAHLPVSLAYRQSRSGGAGHRHERHQLLHAGRHQRRAQRWHQRGRAPDVRPGGPAQSGEGQERRLSQSLDVRPPRRLHRRRHRATTASENDHRRVTRRDRGWDACSGLGTPDGAKILARPLTAGLLHTGR